MRLRTRRTFASLPLVTSLLLAWGLSACNGLIGLDDPKLDITNPGGSTGGSAGSSSTKASGGTGAAAGNSSTAGSSADVSRTGGTGSGTTVGGSGAGGSSSTPTTGGNAGASSTTTSTGLPLATGGLTSAGGTSSTRTSTGGGSSTGGTTSSTGGVPAIGGTASAGGANPTGGTAAIGAGGVAQSGGASTTGGTSVATGGSIATGGSTPAETTPPALTASGPTGTNANPTDSVTGTFSEPLNCSTVTATSFAVLDDSSAPVPGALSCSGQSVTFRPALGFTLNSSYQVKLTGAIRDPAGNALADAPLSWSFKVREGIWDSSPVAMDMTADANTPMVTICNSGDAMVTWSRNVGGGVSNIWSNRWVASGSKWVGAESAYADAEQSVSPTGLGCDDSGSYVATWTQAVSGYNAMFQVWASRFAAGVGWGLAKQVSKDPNGAAMSVSQATQANGDAAVVWTQYNRMDGSNNHGWVARYTAGSNSWTDASTFANDVNDCSVAMDASGRVLGLFSSKAAASMQVFDWPPAGGVGAPVPIETNSTTQAMGYSQRGVVRVDGSGTFLAVWVRPQDAGGRVLWNRRIAGSSWETADFVDTGTADVGPLDLAVNPSGRASAIWPAWDSSYGWIYQAQRAPSGTYWNLDGAKLTGYGTTYPASEFSTAAPKVVMDPKGNTIAVWRRGDVNWSARLNAIANPPRWTDAVRLNGPNIGLDPVIAIHPSGVALAAWQENDAAGSHIYVRWFR